MAQAKICDNCKNIINEDNLLIQLKGYNVKLNR